MCFLCKVYVRMQCSVLLYSLLYKYYCTAVCPPPPPQCSYCSRHRLSGRRSSLHPQFTAQLVGACSYWHLGTEHVYLWPCAYYNYFLRLKFLTTKFLTGDAVCTVGESGTRDAPPCGCLPLSLFDLIAVPLSLLLHFIPLSLSLLCLPIWAVLHHLHMYMVAFLALRILYVVALVCFVFVPWCFPS